MPFRMDVELATVRITRRRHLVDFPDTCPACEKPLRGEEGVGLSLQGLTFCEVGAKVPEDFPPLDYDDETEYSNTTVDTGVSCGACGALLYGDDVIMTPPCDTSVPPPEATAPAADVAHIPV